VYSIPLLLAWVVGVVLVVLAFGIGLALYWVLRKWLRRPPTMVAGKEVRSLFLGVAQHERFQERAGRLGSLDSSELLKSVQKASFRYACIHQGGYAGRPDGPPPVPVVLGLSRLHRRWAVAAHELLHLVRDLTGGHALDDETGVWREECRVWYHTIRYSPLWGSLEFLAPLVALSVVLSGLMEIEWHLFGKGSFIGAMLECFQ